MLEGTERERTAGPEGGSGTRAGSRLGRERPPFFGRSAAPALRASESQEASDVIFQRAQNKEWRA